MSPNLIKRLSELAMETADRRARTAQYSEIYEAVKDGADSAFLMCQSLVSQKVKDGKLKEILFNDIQKKRDEINVVLPQA